jgi:hypothetical protein
MFCIVADSVGAIDKGMVPSLPLRLSLSNERGMVNVNRRDLRVGGAVRRTGSRESVSWEGSDVRKRNVLNTIGYLGGVAVDKTRWLCSRAPKFQQRAIQI